MGRVYMTGGGGRGLDPDELTASASDVLSGKKAGVQGSDEPVNGTMPIVFGLMLFGAFSYYQLPKQEDPKIKIREAVVTTAYPGMSAKKVVLTVKE